MIPGILAAQAVEVGASLPDGTGVGAAAGTSTVAGIGASVRAAAGSSAGTGAASGTSPPPPLLIDPIASVTGAWSLSRDMKTSFVGGTRYVAFTSKISEITDQTGNTRKFYDVGNSGVRPDLTTAGPNSKACADFDGTSYSLTTNLAMSNFLSNTSGAICFSIIMDAVVRNNGNIYDNDKVCGASNHYVGITAKNVGGTTPTFFGWHADTIVNTTSPGIACSTGTAYVLLWRHHGGTLYFSVNGGTESTVANGSAYSLAGLFHMAVGNGGNTNMKFFEGFTSSDGSQTAALAAAVADMKAWVGA